MPPQCIFTVCTTVWYGSTTAMDRRRLHRVVKTAEKITRAPLLSLQTIYYHRVHRRAASVLKDPGYPNTDCLQSCPQDRDTEV